MNKIFLILFINIELFAYPFVKNNNIVDIKNTKELINKLEENKLLDIKEDSVDRLFIKNFPKDLKNIDTKLKKKLFFHSILPGILKINEKIKKEREFILKIYKKYKDKNINFNYLNSFMYLDFKSILMLSYLCNKYNSFELNVLLDRINTITPSLVLAQSAIESFWGGSRFSLEGNNIFGIWTKNNREKGLVPKKRRKYQKHRVKTYNSIQESIEDYFHKLNTVRAYRSFRRLRRKSNDSLVLALGLKHYSAKKEKYIKDLQKLIKKNNLKKFDKLKLN